MIFLSSFEWNEMVCSNNNEKICEQKINTWKRIIKNNGKVFDYGGQIFISLTIFLTINIFQLSSYFLWSAYKNYLCKPMMRNDLYLNIFHLFWFFSFHIFTVQTVLVWKKKICAILFPRIRYTYRQKKLLRYDFHIYEMWLDARISSTTMETVYELAEARRLHERAEISACISCCFVRAPIVVFFTACFSFLFCFVCV